MCAKFGPDRTTDGDVYTLGRIHTQTHTLLYRYRWECQWYGIGLDRFCHKNSARYRFRGDKMINFTKPFGRNRLVVRKRIRCQWSPRSFVFVRLHNKLWRLYNIFLCLSSLPSILCCAFTYFPYLGTTPFTKPFNAKWHCLQCYFFKLPPTVNFSLFKHDFVWQYWLQ